jgi:hypothetical protein
LQGEVRGPEIYPFAPEASSKHAAAQLGKGQVTDRAQLTNEEIVINERFAGGTADSFDVTVDRARDRCNTLDFSARHLGILVKLLAVARTDQQ